MTLNFSTIGNLNLRRLRGRDCYSEWSLSGVLENWEEGGWLRIRRGTLWDCHISEYNRICLGLEAGI